MALGESTTFGPFQLIRRLGVGGMAETFVAERRGPAGFIQRVCVKRVLPAYGSDAEFVRAFQSEARLAAELHHSGIAQVIDFGEHDGTYWLALELVEGVDLRTLLSRLKRERESFPRTLIPLVLADLLQSLDYAHRRNIEGKPARIVHRDVSPSNVLLGFEGEIKLADFGIAKAATHTHVTRSGAIKGKIPYMSPEQARGADVDGRSDLFSLGVVAFELVCGRRPFDGATELETLANVTTGNAHALIELAPDVAPWLLAMIMRLLAHERELRFPSAAAALDVLPIELLTPQRRREMGALIRRFGNDLVYPRSEDTQEQGGTEAFSSMRDVANAATALLTPVTAPTRTSLPADAVREATGRKSTSSNPGAAPATRTSSNPPTRSHSHGGGGAPHNLRASPPLNLSRIVAVSLIGLVVGALILLTLFSKDPSKLLIVGARGPLRPDGRAPQVLTSPHLLTEPSSKPGKKDGTGGTPPATSSASSSSTIEAARPANTPASLQVRVVPWGAIWIDGRRVGEGAVRKTVPPGRHVVGAGLDAPTVTQTIELRSGESRSVTLRGDRSGAP